MSYTSNTTSFDMADYISYIVGKLPKDQQTDEIRKTVEANVARVVIQTIRNFMTYEDLEDLIEKMDKNDEKANEIIVEYINNYPELQTQLTEEMDHFESLASRFF